MLARVNPPAATGSVKFMDGPTCIGTEPLNAGQATLTTSNLAPGSKTITAVYTGDGNHAGSTSPALIHTVEKRATTATISSTPNPSTSGQPVTFTAVVAATPSDGATPNGTVSFYAGDTALGTASLDTKGAANFSTPALSAGKYEVKAVYRGSDVFAESTSTPITHIVQ
ncbi:MAG TPA: Ig-like domain-containing protein [Bryobacteraceae bacterium]|nr:Ig-like domain-containing protein [Bryobacteraceae bacterium]